MQEVKFQESTINRRRITNRQSAIQEIIINVIDRFHGSGGMLIPNDERWTVIFRVDWTRGGVLAIVDGSDCKHANEEQNPEDRGQRNSAMSAKS